MFRKIGSAVDLFKPFYRPITSKCSTAVDSRRNIKMVSPIAAGSSSKSSRKPVRITDELIYGKHVVHAALRAGRRQIHQLFLRNDELRSSSEAEIMQFTAKTIELNEIAAIAEQKRVTVSRVPVRVLDILSPGCVHQGVIADCSRLPANIIRNQIDESSLASDLDNELTSRVVLFLDRVVDPQNLGAAVRNAVYFGASRNVLITSHDSSKPTVAASKASAGALELTNLHRVVSPRSCLQQLKSHFGDRIDLVAAVSPQFQSSDKNVMRLVDYMEKRRLETKSGKSRKILLIVGSEGRGIADEIIQVCDSLVTIERSDSKDLEHADLVDCLNVSNAVAVLLHAMTGSN